MSAASDPWIAAGVVAAVVSLCAIAPMLARYAAQRRLARLCARRRTVVLTYDDGPGERATPELLDLLRARGARASFFVLGRKAEVLPAVLDRAVGEGHEVGSHSYSHVHAWKSPWRAWADVAGGFRATAPWVPAGGLFRPPYGKLSPFTWAAARVRGARFAWWTHDSGDTWEHLPAADHVVDEVRRAGGGVVLLHDFDRDDTRAKWALDATDRLLAMANAEGLRVATLGELLRDDGAAAR